MSNTNTYSILVTASELMSRGGHCRGQMRNRSGAHCVEGAILRRRSPWASPQPMPARLPMLSRRRSGRCRGSQTT